MTRESHSHAFTHSNISLALLYFLALCYLVYKVSHYQKLSPKLDLVSLLYLHTLENLKLLIASLHLPLSRLYYQ